tara:strand:+ start:637 stop:792 length:156 start_codon:yes stop_codon:yes gene_type:complete
MEIFKEKKKDCPLCLEQNENYNFTCRSCGFDMDFVVTYNMWGLPVLKPRVK